MTQVSQAQRSPRLIAPIAASLTPSVAATARAVSPAPIRLRADRTSSTVNFVPGSAAARAIRPRPTQSAEFSSAVPVIRCSGFTHRRLSHVCRSNSPSGIGPFLASQDTRCARRDFLSIRTHPYPLGCTDAIQFQHPDTGSTSDRSLIRQASEQVRDVSHAGSNINPHTAQKRGFMCCPTTVPMAKHYTNGTYDGSANALTVLRQ